MVILRRCLLSSPIQCPTSPDSSFIHPSPRWVHHIPDATKDELKSLLSIPLLAETPTPHSEEEVFGKAPAAAVQSAMAGYKTATGCGICHASDFTVCCPAPPSRRKPLHLPHYTHLVASTSIPRLQWPCSADPSPSAIS